MSEVPLWWCVGRSHEYLSLLESIVTSDRRAVLYDALGSGESTPLAEEVRNPKPEKRNPVKFFGFRLRNPKPGSCMTRWALVNRRPSLMRRDSLLHPSPKPLNS